MWFSNRRTKFKKTSGNLPPKSGGAAAAAVAETAPAALAAPPAPASDTTTTNDATVSELDPDCEVVGVVTAADPAAATITGITLDGTAAASSNVAPAWIERVWVAAVERAH